MYDTQSMFITKNRYGYRTDVRNPQMYKLYKIYRKKMGMPCWCPMSDNERFLFDARTIWYIVSLSVAPNRKLRVKHVSQRNM